MNPNCDVCMYRSNDKLVCFHEGPCRGDVQSTGQDNKIRQIYEKSIKNLQLTELIAIKAVIDNMIKEWYDGEKGKN